MHATGSTTRSKSSCRTGLGDRAREKTMANAAPATGTRAARKGPFAKLYVQVLIAIGLGMLLGHFYPTLATQMKPLSDGFIRLIRSIVPLIIFATVAIGIAKIGDIRRVGVVGVRALIYFEVVSTIALFIGLAVGICSTLEPAFISTRRLWMQRRSLGMLRVRSH